MARYLICSEVIFDDDLYEMWRTDDAENVVQLGAAASRCLQVLLEANGQIVTKKDFLYKGWVQYHNIVTGNSVNQAIAQIRKNFELLHLSPQGIVTATRIGYKISDSFAVEKMEGIKNPTPNTETIVPVNAAPELNVSNPPVTAIPSLLPSTKTGKKRKKAWLFFSLILLNAGLAFGARWFFGHNFIENVAPVAYVNFKQIGDLHYFAVKNVVGGSIHVESSIAMLNRHPPSSVSIKNNKYVYINGASRDGVYSYFLCQNRIEEKNNHCVSYLTLLEERK